MAWQSLQPPTQSVWVQSKIKGEGTIGQLYCPGSAVRSPPGAGERHFPAFPRESHSLGSGKAWATWELVLWA